MFVTRKGGLTIVIESAVEVEKPAPLSVTCCFEILWMVPDCRIMFKVNERYDRRKIEESREMLGRDKLSFWRSTWAILVRRSVRA